MTDLELLYALETVAASSSSSTAASWTSNEVAPATTEEIKVASYLIISAAFNDYDPKSTPLYLGNSIILLTRLRMGRCRMRP